MKFVEEKKLTHKLGRAGILSTRSGVIHTPSFVVVGTKATVKGVTPLMLHQMHAQVVLVNTYHLYLEPGDTLVRDAGGVGKFMGWDGPTMSDSGGFQVFSLGAAYGKRIGKIESVKETPHSSVGHEKPQLVAIDEEGVTFRSHRDGSSHRFTPERAVGIEHHIGADMIFAFDECTSPEAPYAYQREAMERTHRWAERSLVYHRAYARPGQDMFGVIQGGRFPDLRKESARAIREMGFDGFGIGGSFEKEDMHTAVAWVTQELPSDQPRHLLGIGEPRDLFLGVEHGIDLFDCVAPTRIGRNGTLYTYDGKINILNSRFLHDFSPIDASCTCTTCRTSTRAYLAHLFRSRELLAYTLASVHNLHFLISLVREMRTSILEERFDSFRNTFLSRFYRE